MAVALLLALGIPVAVAAMPPAEAESNLADADSASDTYAGSLPAGDASVAVQASPAPETPPFSPSWDTAGKENCPYLVAVNRAAGCVTVFGQDTAQNYTVPLRAMICSGGRATPLGRFSIGEHYRWRLLNGGVYGQYATRITGHILFHSVPYSQKSPAALETWEYNRLGSVASQGCIRLTVFDAMWIYTNCPQGTPVVLYDDAACPGPLACPQVATLSPMGSCAGWDPEDPDPANPWHAA